MVPRKLATTIHVHCRAELISKAWYFGSRNVRSLVDNEGTVETARLSSEMGESEDGRIDLVGKMMFNFLTCILHVYHGE